VIGVHAENVRIPEAAALIDGDLRVPVRAVGLVIFAHGSGSSRFSRRNRMVATFLEERGLATLLLDLLTPEEERVDESTREYRFDIERLARRVVAAIDWVATRPELTSLPVCLFGASTGAAAALVAASMRRGSVQAVVSRGGRPDLAGEALPLVEAPTLLIVGGHDEQVIALNRNAIARMTGPAQLAIVPGATHLFEEAGTLEEVCRLAAQWCAAHLPNTGASNGGQTEE
jgi:putative phosphoribosyl transferase